MDLQRGCAVISLKSGRTEKVRPQISLEIPPLGACCLIQPFRVVKLIHFLTCGFLEEAPMIPPPVQRISVGLLPMRGHVPGTAVVKHLSLSLSLSTSLALPF